MTLLTVMANLLTPSPNTPCSLIIILKCLVPQDSFVKLCFSECIEILRISQISCRLTLLIKICLAF